MDCDMRTVQIIFLSMILNGKLIASKFKRMDASEALV